MRSDALAGLIAPVVDADAAIFWAGVAEGRLLVPSCRDCGRRFLPPLPCCPACRSEAIEPIEACGRGRLYSWVIMRRALDPAYAEAVPYVVAAVELEEGARIFARLIDVDPEDPAALVAEMPLALRFVEIDGQRMWAFAPATSSEPAKSPR
ncbi:MAG: OB-fold domain-containing protein [Deltaproteobacteria bacterium]|nr:OB-fold domain-containing protein [Deltaproteobacteria bacterium]